jgi:class 3 adenylate cyclase/tetratricopeptide (TPR) repeat protein
MAAPSSLACRVCRVANRPGRRFCADCGAPLAAPCGACGFENEEGERFCGGCGAQLGAAPPAAAKATVPTAPATAPAAPPATDGAERRQLTVMFCDLVGSTSLSTRVDPEDLRDLMRTFQERAAAQIARFDGFIARYMGDGILVYFGYPRAHEDDAERCVRAALGIVEACADLGAEVRLGLATGLAVVGDLVGEGASEERTVVGETPNLAARLQALAPPGGIVISQTTHDLLHGRFETDALGAHALKGFADPVPVFAVKGARDAESRFEARRRAGLAPLTGRERELGLLEDRWSTARGGDGQVVLLVADAGLGKSRLLAALEQAAGAEAHHMVRLQASPHQQASPLRPAIDWLARIADILPGDAPARRFERLEALVPVARRGERLPHLAALLSLPPDARYPEPEGAAEQRKERVLAALVGQIEDLARQRPVLVVFEDAQWADATSLDLIDRLVDRAESLPLMLVVTGRPELRPRWATRPHTTQLTLNRLTSVQSTALVRALTAERPIAAEVVTRLVERADGVPLFLEELCRGALDVGMLAIPATLHESLLARLDRLPASREVAQAAAVLGREFNLDLLSVVTGRPQQPLQRALDELVDEAVIINHGGGRYSFRHSLVRDVAYQSLLRRGRQKLHGAAARALIDVAGQSDSQPELVAMHLAEAGDAAQAIDWWERAARRADQNWNFGDAIAQRERALALLPAADAIETADLAARRTAVDIDRANTLRLAERPEEALAVLAAAEPLCARFDLPALMSRLSFTRGNLLFQLGRAAECAQSHERALAEARRAGSVEAEARALGGLGDAHHMRGAFVSSRAAFTKCVETAAANGLHEIECDNMPMLAMAAVFHGDPAAARPLAERAVELAETLRRPRALGVATSGLTMVLCEVGEIDAAVSAAQRAHELAKRRGSRFFEALARFNCAHALRLAGREPEGLAMIEESPELEHPSFRLIAAALGPRLARLRRDALILQQAIDGMDMKTWNMGMVWFVPDSVVGCVELEAWETLSRLLDRLAPAMPAEPAVYFSAPVQAAHALLALRRDGGTPANRDAARAALAAIVASGAVHSYAPLRERLQAALG